MKQSINIIAAVARNRAKGALPNRRNVVLSRGVKDVNDERFPGCDCYPTLRKALESCQPEEEVYIIGGSSVYQQALPLATRLCLTEVDDIPAEADAFFPPYEDSWQEVWREEHDTDERHDHRYAFVDYVWREEHDIDERHAHRYAFVDYVKKEDSTEEATPQEESTPQA